MKNIQTFPNFLFDSSDNFLSFLKKYRKILLIHSNFINKNNLLQRIKDKFGDKIEFYNISMNKIPINTKFYNQISSKSEFDLILAIGGGSVIDVGKIFYAKTANRKFLFSAKRSFSVEFKSEKVDFATLVTLPGSGAESSKTSIINYSNKKYFFISRNFVPKYVAYDFETISNNNYINQLFRMIDSLMHGIESRETILSSTFADYLSKNIIINSKKVLKKILKNKDLKFSPSILKEMCAISFYGGIVQSECGSSLGHAIAHSLESCFKLSHSESIFLAAFVKLNYEKKNKNKSKIIQFESLLRFIYSNILSNKDRIFYNKVINNMNLSKFLEIIKSDPCYKLTNIRIDEKKLENVMRLIKKKKKWNI